MRSTPMVKDDVIRAIERKYEAAADLSEKETDPQIRALYRARCNALVNLFRELKPLTQGDASFYHMRMNDILHGYFEVDPDLRESLLNKIEDLKVSDLPEGSERLIRHEIHKEREAASVKAVEVMNSCVEAAGMVVGQDQIERNFIGFFIHSLAAGGTANVIAQPYQRFKGRRLVVAPECADKVMILDMKVGSVSCFTSYESGLKGTLFPPIPLGLNAEELEAYAKANTIDLPTCEVSQQFNLVVTNFSPKSIQFSAVVWGYVGTPLRTRDLLEEKPTYLIAGNGEGDGGSVKLSAGSGEAFYDDRGHPYDKRIPLR